MSGGAADLAVAGLGTGAIAALSGLGVIATYRIVLGGAPVGHKRQQGDRRTPEGDYRITYRNDRSRFHLSLRVSYPNEADRQQAAARIRGGGAGPEGAARGGQVHAVSSVVGGGHAAGECRAGPHCRKLVITRPMTFRHACA